MDISPKTLKQFIRFQQNGITESIVYERLASIDKNESNRKILKQTSLEEKAHYFVLKNHTGIDV